MVFAERLADRLLPSQPDHQAKRLFHRLLLVSVPGSLLRFRHQRVIDLDIGAQAWLHGSVYEQIPRTYAFAEVDVRFVGWVERSDTHQWCRGQ